MYLYFINLLLGLKVKKLLLAKLIKISEKKQLYK